MEKEQAIAVAEILRGEVWSSGGDIWLVVFRRSDGKVVVLSDEIVKVYDNDDAFEEDKSNAEVLLH